MRGIAKVFLVIGLVAGTIGSVSTALTLYYGDYFADIIRSTAPEDDKDAQTALQSLKQSSEKSLVHVLYFIGISVLVIAGAVLIFVAVSPERKRNKAIVFSIVGVACGVTLIVFRSWIAGVCYVAGGILAMVAKMQKGTSQPKFRDRPSIF